MPDGAARVIPQKNFFIMSAVARKPFSYIFIGEANKNIDQAKDVRTKSEKTSAFEMVSTEVLA